MSLQDILANSIEDVLVPNESVNRDALACLKQALDSVAGQYTPLGAVHVDGLKPDQVWVQAQMVLEGVTQKLGERLAGDASEMSQDESEASEGDSELSEDSEQEEVGEEDSEEVGEEVGEENSEEVSEEDLQDAMVDLQDDYVESEASQEEGQESSEKFDLAEFQQHVLQLEQDGDSDEESIDYNAEISDSDSEDMHYKDFFAPARKTSKVAKSIPLNEEPMEPMESENDVMEATRKDLFDSDLDLSEEPEGEQLSKFERQQQELARQISELENENVGEKEWGMRGEAQAKDRPEESLFSIQFERNAKAAPVITEESTLSVEEMIKERIRKQQFDDIPRRSEVVHTQKKELPELSDQKSQKSLAEEYEDDQMRAANPEYFARQDAQAMDSAHKEIVDLFTSVSRKLDALCSWQFTPRAPTPSLSIVSDAPSIAMEEAQPGTMSHGDQLAPQEVFRTDAAVPMADQEMTTSMKRKRRRDKARSKQEAQKPKKAKSGKEEMFNTLKRGNVTMVDKKGQKRNMRGETVLEKRSTASDIKL